MGFLNNNQGTGQNTQQSQGNNQQGGGGSKMLLILAVLAIAVIVVVIIVGYLVLSSFSSAVSTSANTSSTSTAPSSSQTRSLNTTPIEMSEAQAQTLIRSSLSEYSGYDLFNPDSPTNISDLESVVPQLYGNATSGWVTFAAGSNATANASIEYVVITTSYAQQIASDLNNATLYDLPMTLESENSGSVDGFVYTYAQYVNSTASFQAVSGYKNGHAVGATVNSYPIFTMNETDLIDTIANDTP